MLYTLLFAAVAYLLYFLYDWCTVKKQMLSVARLFFPLGTLFVGIATVFLLQQSIRCFAITPFAILSLILAFVCGYFLYDALVLSLPKGTYTEPDAPRKVFRGRMYALCRHPGVLWYCCMYFFLWAAAPSYAGAIQCFALCVGNVLYMFLQDAWTFPSVFFDYNDYKTETPLFFPTRKSIQACVHSYRSSL